MGRTLAELERKLHELERALNTVGEGDRPAQPRLVDEAARPGGADAHRAEQPPQARERIDLAELVAFRDRLEQTMRELVAEYDRIISLHRAPAER